MSEKQGETLPRMKGVSVGLQRHVCAPLSTKLCALGSEESRMFRLCVQSKQEELWQSRFEASPYLGVLTTRTLTKNAKWCYNHDLAHRPKKTCCSQESFRATETVTIATLIPACRCAALLRHWPLCALAMLPARNLFVREMGATRNWPSSHEAFKDCSHVTWASCLEFLEPSHSGYRKTPCIP